MTAKYTGKTVRIKSTAKHFQYPHFSGGVVHLEDDWKKITGESWMYSDGNPAAMIYGMRAGMEGLPNDDNVLYGKLGSMGVLVHVSEIAEIIPEENPA